MTTGIDSLLAQYEHGHITRREYLARVTSLVAAARVATAAEPAISPVNQLNHVTMSVRDVQRSTEFYQQLFGMPVLTRQGAGVNLKAGSSFLGIYPAEGRPAGINHVCLGLNEFDADAVLRKLKERHLNASIRLRGDTKELYFNDPDDIRVQLQDVRYIGGAGPLGDRPAK